MKAENILRMTLKKEWFDQIVAGTKKKEYRDHSPYWEARLLGRKYDSILFVNGYSKTSPTVLVEYKGYKLDQSQGQYIISLGKILKASKA